MLFQVGAFNGFSPEAFAAFEERKWASNRFNLERMKTRARLQALGQGLGPLLGDEAAGLVFGTTLDHPHIFNRSCVSSMWLYLDRPEEERTELTRIVDKDLTLKEKVGDPVPQHQAALTGVEVCHEGVKVFFRMHSSAVLDRRNLCARLDDPMELQQFGALLAKLDSSFQVRLDGTVSTVAGSGASVGAIRAALDRGEDWFGVERSFSRDDPAIGSSTFSQLAAELLRPLLSVWRFAAWSRTNDRLKISRVLKEEKKEKARRLTGFEPGDTVTVVSGLLGGKKGVVQSVDLKGRVKVQLGRVTVDMDSKLLKKS